MRNSAEPVPWTHRDSRPRTQAELDEEESFDVYRRMKIPRPIASDLHQRLENYQRLITKLLLDAAFREEIDIETETAYDRNVRKRSEKTQANVKKKGLYSKTQAEREAKHIEKLKADHRWPRRPLGRGVPPSYFGYLEKMFSEPEPEPEPPKPKPVYDSFESAMEAIFQEYHLYTEELREAWRPALSQLAKYRMETTL